jgi:hypothetical protein
MSFPILTDQEKKDVNKEKTTQTNLKATMLSQIPANQATADHYQSVDNAFKKFFSYYNLDIIGQYDSERRSIDGNYIVSPISETDIVNTAQVLADRTTPVLPSTDIVRVPEFDGSPLIIDTNNELQNILNQAVYENTLVSGYPPGTYPSTLKTNSVVIPSSTSIDLKDTVTLISIAINDVFVLSTLSDFAICKVTSVTPGSLVSPYTSTVGITFITAPSVSIPSATTLLGFSGFTNSERISKTASDSNYQPLMNQLILSLQNAINARLANQVTQTTALNANQDPDAVTQIATTLSQVSASTTSLTNYLITTDISNSGIASLAAERATRTTQLNTRVTQIVNNYTNQTKNYYNERYTFANDRANTARGSLRLYYASLQAITTAQGYATQSQNMIDALNSIAT